jgi:hypothetical protein
MNTLDHKTTILHQDTLEPTVVALDQYLAIPSPQGLLRIGSSARGELVGHRVGNHIEALGDVEYIHLAISKADSASMQRRVDEAKREFGDTFQDIAVSSIRGYQLRHLRHRFWLWEAIRCGKIVAGHDFRPLLPTLTIDTLDARELNEILLWRMLKLVQSITDPRLPDHSGGVCDERCFPIRFHLARQMLDLTTWWLPRQGVLMSGFGPRVARFAQEGLVPSKIRDLVTDAWTMRQTGHDHRSCAQWVEEGSKALLWADDERLRSSTHESRFGDTDLRSQATRFKFYVQREPAHTVRRTTTIARSRSLLYRQLRGLLEMLANSTAMTQAPAMWEEDRLRAIDFAVNTIEWVTAES